MNQQRDSYNSISYKLLPNLIDDNEKIDLVKSGLEYILYSFLLMNTTEKNRDGDLLIALTNACIQNKNNYPQSIVDVKRRINNYVPKFVKKNNQKKVKRLHQQKENDKQLT